MEETPLLSDPSVLKDTSDLSFKVKAGYSIGHVLNDLCAATWFTYLLVFLEAIGLTKVQAGVVMLCGQLADGLMTPCVGILSDNCSIRGQCMGFGRRKLWHLSGSCIVVVCYTAVFGYLPYSIYKKGGLAMMYYYAIAASLFNIGWACVQVSHMALVPELHENPGVRTQLNAGRYAFTILSNSTVFILYIIISPLYHERPYPIQSTFQTITTVVVCIGMFATAMFHSLVLEPSNNHNNSLEKFIGKNKQLESGLGSFKWFKKPAFWLTGVNYMCTRLFVNLSQVYIAFYVVDTLKMPDTARATIPLTVYASCFVATLPQKTLFKCIGRSRSYFVGAFSGIGAAIGFFFLPQNSIFIYVVAVLLGCANSTMMVATVSLEADLIGDNLRSNAFVYGILSLGDKVSNGVVVMLIQGARQTVANGDDSSLLRYVMSGVIGLAAVLASVGIALLSNLTVEEKKSTFDGERSEYGAA